MSQPLIWAHRGASEEAPENTLPAFRLAAEEGADGVELDVQLSRDGQIVVCHDEKIDRTSDGKGWVKDYTLAELKQFDFCYRKPGYRDVRIPTLAEVLELLKPTGLTVNIEIKTGIFFYDRIEEKVLELVRAEGWEDRVIYSSFNHETLRTLRRLNPSCRTGILYADGPVDVVSYALRIGADALHPALYNLQYPGVLAEAREKGVEINVWTVNETEHLKYCVQAGVHAVITNVPEKARRVIENPGDF